MTKDPKDDALVALLKDLRAPLAQFRKEIEATGNARYYCLDGHTPVPCFNVLEWAVWFESADSKRIVQQTQVGEYWISTVFLGLNHRLAPGIPILFETIVFIGKKSSDMERYCTWDEALAGHVRICAALKESG